MVTGVPKTIVNDQVEILGALPQDVFVEQALAQFTIDNLQLTTRRAVAAAAHETAEGLPRCL